MHSTGKEQEYPCYPLYYLARVKGKEPVEQLESTGEVDKQYLNVAIPYSDADMTTALASAACYKSQFTPAELEE